MLDTALRNASNYGFAFVVLHETTWGHQCFPIRHLNKAQHMWWHNRFDVEQRQQINLTMSERCSEFLGHLILQFDQE
uniref:Hydrolase n=1 Tax=Echinococcus granulosus TaxID=6210 RepID=A0A068WPL5_ECHGR|nr:hypothetical protein EgrG_002025500 [Echinococcus granulosus]